MRFAYADPPYIGQAKKLYGDHPDYAGEVDHAELVARLVADYDGWALSLSVRSLPAVMRLCPLDVLTLAWVKPIAPPMGDHRIYSWEPVLLAPLRRPAVHTRMHVEVSPPQFTFRPRPAGHVIGEKPEAFAHWLFRCAGLLSTDDLADLFPGSGAIGRAWRTYSAEGELAL